MSDGESTSRRPVPGVDRFGSGSFAENRVLVTGGANGIGRAVAQAFLAEGAEVLVCDIDDDAGKQWATQERASFAHVDVTMPDQLLAVFEEPSLPFDIVIVNVGVPLPRQSFLDVSRESFVQMQEVNLVSAFDTIRFASRRLADAGLPGRIVVSCTVGSFTPQPGFAAYCAAKYGLLGLLKSVALELAPRNILVNGVCPGDVNTRFLEEPDTDGEVFSGMLGRRAEPAEVASAYLWLAGPGASYAVGETLVLDAGLSLSALR